MEVKINKEIRAYTESVFFGLSLRQCIFSVLALGIAVAIFFALRGRLVTEVVSWLCILGATPAVVAGFVAYHGMTAEQFIGAWLKSEVLMPKRLAFKGENLYLDALALAPASEQKRGGGRRADAPASDTPAPAPDAPAPDAPAPAPNAPAPNAPTSEQKRKGGRHA
jgi:hypothetical protein